MKYTKHTLASELEIELRGRTYNEWEDAEKQRIESLESVSALYTEGKATQAEIKINQDFHALRTKRLTLYVKNFEAVRGKLAMRDVCEIERLCASMEKEEIQEKN